MRKTTIPVAFVILGSVLGSSWVGAQSFGLNDQTTTIGASAFRPASGANVTYDLSTDGYLHGDGQCVAPLDYVFRSSGDLGSGVRNLTYRIRYSASRGA